MALKGFLQASGVTVYVGMVSLFMFNVQKIFGNQPDKFYAPIIFLLLFISSALICALIVFYQPYLLFFNKHKKQALELIMHTTVWLFLFFIAVLITAVMV